MFGYKKVRDRRKFWYNLALTEGSGKTLNKTGPDEMVNFLKRILQFSENTKGRSIPKKGILVTCSKVD